MILLNTPGPWKALQTSEATWVLSCDEYRFVRVYADGREPLDAGALETAAANARLIAASPDLLAALERLERIVIDAAIFPHQDDLMEAGAALKESRTALMKARRETPAKGGRTRRAAMARRREPGWRDAVMAENEREECNRLLRENKRMYEALQIVEWHCSYKVPLARRLENILATVKDALDAIDSPEETNAHTA